MAGAKTIGYDGDIVVMRTRVTHSLHRGVIAWFGTLLAGCRISTHTVGSEAAG